LKPVSKSLDHFLTGFYFLTVIWVVIIFYNDILALGLLVFCIFATHFGIQVVKWFFNLTGGWFSRTCLNYPPLNNPLAKRKAMKKFCDQAWQFAFHAFFFLFELYILNTNEDEAWWGDTKTCWVPHPSVQPLRPALKIFYISQLASYIFLGFSHRFWEERRSDYVIMFSHHISTTILVAGSYSNGYHRIGLLILLVHDISDLPVDMLKMLNYLKLEGFRGFFLVEIMFATVILSWAYLRLWIFPSKLIYSTLIESHHLAGRSAHDGEIWKDLFPPGMPFWLVANVCLSVLYVCHWVWFRLFLKLLIKVIRLGPHKAGEDDYEGRSDEDNKEH